MQSPWAAKIQQKAAEQNELRPKVQETPRIEVEQVPVRLENKVKQTVAVTAELVQQIIDNKIAKFEVMSHDFFQIVQRKEKAKLYQSGKPYPPLKHDAKDVNSKFSRQNFKKLDPNVKRI